MTSSKKSGNRRLFEGAGPTGPSVERRIHFYEIDAGLNTEGRREIYDAVPALEHLMALPHKIEGGRYLASENKSLLCADPVSLEYPQKVIYYFSRRADLPEVEREGKFSPLVIPKDSGLGERCHLVFFGRYVAADFNFHAPRPTTFPAYLAAKAKGLVPSARFRQLLRGEATEELEKLDGLLLARMKLGRSSLDLIKEADESLAASIRATMNATNADEVEIVLRRTRKTRKQPTRYLSDRLFKVVKWLAGRPETYEQFETLKTLGVGKISARREPEIDVLEDQLIVSKMMIKTSERSRAIDSDHAFRQIEAAYKEVKPGFASASTLY